MSVTVAGGQHFTKAKGITKQTWSGSGFIASNVHRNNQNTLLDIIIVS